MLHCCWVITIWKKCLSTPPVPRARTMAHCRRHDWRANPPGCACGIDVVYYLGCFNTATACAARKRRSHAVPMVR